MRVLCTGGAGYVGSAALRWLLCHGHEAWAYDNLLEGNREAVPEGRLIVGDILDGEGLRRSMKELRIDAVMHFAALASVPDSIRQPREYWRVNLEGTKVVLDAMVETGVRSIVFSSTAATFSFEAEMPLTEFSRQEPRVPYGTSKLAAEWLIRDYARAYGMGFAVLRYFNASGADPDGRFGEDRRHESHLIPCILLTAVGRRPEMVIYGNDWPTPDGTCVRDFVHTDDLASAHQLAVEALRPGDERYYNVGSGTGTTVKQVLEACERAVGGPIPHRYAERRPGDPGVLVASPARLRSELGWKPRVGDIEGIVRTAWAWHRSHPEGYGTGASSSSSSSAASTAGGG